MDKHHIVPKHMGGLGPGHPLEHLNIMELSREDHAWAHLILYKLYGKHQDLAAAQLLTCHPYQKGVPRPDMMGDKNSACRPGVGAKITKSLLEYYSTHPGSTTGKRWKSPVASRLGKLRVGEKGTNWKGGIAGKPGSDKRKEYMREYGQRRIANFRAQGLNWEGKPYKDEWTRMGKRGEQLIKRKDKL